MLSTAVMSRYCIIIIITNIIILAYTFDVTYSSSSPCSTCIHRRCHSDGECIHGCTVGSTGPRCNKTCINCLRGCGRTSGVCDQCKPGLYDTYCNKNCPEHCYTDDRGRQYCDRDDGHCLDNCEVGMHGSHCQTPCSEYCTDNQCYGTNGYCTYPCQSGRYGSHCKSVCDSHCISGCKRHDGHCIGECGEGWVGPFCNKTCQVGRYGTGCRYKCSVNCLMSCEHSTGNCLTKCVNGTCESVCKEGFYGRQCDNKCMPCKLCHHVTGRCLSCNDGFYGNDCSKFCSVRCQSGKCHINGTCVYDCTNGFDSNCRTINGRANRRSTVNMGPIISKPSFLSYILIIALSLS